MELPNSSTATCEYTSRVVLYLDILGFKAHIHDSLSSGKKRELIRDTIREFREIVRLDAERTETEWSNSFLSSTFSDHFVCSQPLDNPHAIFHIIDAARLNQKDLLERGLLARGAITVGGLYHDNDGVFGPALVEAYEMESRDAIYPRVILSAEAVRLWNEYQSRSIDPSSLIDAHNRITARRMWLQQDKDGWWSTQYLAYLSGSQPTIAPEFTYHAIDSLRHQIIELSGQNAASEQHIRAKYEWLRNDWNVAMRKIAETGLSTEEYLIEAS